MFHNAFSRIVGNDQHRISPDMLPIAGKKIYAEQQQVYGPLNGAFQHIEDEQNLINYRRRENLDVEDIARDSRSRSITGHHNQNALLRSRNSNIHPNATYGDANQLLKYRNSMPQSTLNSPLGFQSTNHQNYSGVELNTENVGQLTTMEDEEVKNPSPVYLTTN